MAHHTSDEPGWIPIFQNCGSPLEEKHSKMTCTKFDHFDISFLFQPFQHENLLFSVQGPKQGFQMLGCRSEPQLWERVAVIETDPVAIKTVPVEKVNLGNSSYQNSSH